MIPGRRIEFQLIRFANFPRRRAPDL